VTPLAVYRPRPHGPLLVHVFPCPAQLAVQQDDTLRGKLPHHRHQTPIARAARFVERARSFAFFFHACMWSRRRHICGREWSECAGFEPVGAAASRSFPTDDGSASIEGPHVAVAGALICASIECATPGRRVSRRQADNRRSVGYCFICHNRRCCHRAYAPPPIKSPRVSVSHAETLFGQS
jgi:hypothetical protein